MAIRSGMDTKSGKRAKSTMPLDPPRQAVQRAIADKKITLKEASRALGRNDAYLHQYLYRHSPRRLPEDVRHALAALVGWDQSRFLDSIDAASWPNNNRMPAAQTQIAFTDITASAGGGAMNEPEAPDGGDPKHSFVLPTTFLRKITPTSSDQLRMITISGDSMAPVLEHGDIVMVDCAQTRPSPAGIFVVDDGVGLVAKRLDLIPNTAPQMLRLTSENSVYTNYQRRIDEVHIIGRVVWFARAL